MWRSAQSTVVLDINLKKKNTTQHLGIWVFVPVSLKFA